MRTSKISQHTTKVLEAISPNSSRRTTRSRGKGISTFALNYDGAPEIKDEPLPDDETAIDSLTNITSLDIEDALPNTPVSTRKRKRGADTPAGTPTIVLTTKTEVTATWTSPRKRTVKSEADSDSDPTTSPSSTQQKAKPKIPARKVTNADGSVSIHPPSNWSELYSIVSAMRRANPTAPVDTMGCEDLFWQNAPPREKRYHTLTALMLSSQTKDTVTAAAMQRLHTELVPQEKSKEGKLPGSGLTVANIISCDAKHLDNLIGKVGFHNNKTKFIKAAALILRDEYASEIPDTIEGLMRLPGVGPKMAYLCMSAAWGVDLGIGVDVHVHRITNLWGWHKTKGPEETRAWLEGWLPRDRWHEINKMLVGLGQLTCLPVGRRCWECDLSGTGLCKGEIRGVNVRERRVQVEKIEKVKGKGQVDLKTEVVKDEVEIPVREEVAGDQDLY